MAALLISKCKCEGACWDLNMGRCKTWTLDWTIGPDDWTGQLDWTIGLDDWMGVSKMWTVEL